MSQNKTIELTNTEIKTLVKHINEIDDLLKDSDTAGEDMACITDICRDSLLPLIKSKLISYGLICTKSEVSDYVVSA